MTDYGFAAFLGFILVAVFFGVGCYSFGYDRHAKGKQKWSNKPFKTLAMILLVLLGAVVAEAGTRTVTWNAVTTYTDNSVIESSNLPVRYDVWYIDNVTSARTNVVVGTTSTSATFDDATMVKGRTYVFHGNAKVQDGSTSADSAGYNWSRPFQVPKTPAGFAFP